MTSIVLAIQKVSADRPVQDSQFCSLVQAVEAEEEAGEAGAAGTSSPRCPSVLQAAQASPRRCPSIEALMEPRIALRFRCPKAETSNMREKPGAWKLMRVRRLESIAA